MAHAVITIEAGRIAGAGPAGDRPEPEEAEAIDERVLAPGALLAQTRA